MSYKTGDVVHETANFWVLRVQGRGFEVLKAGAVCSLRCAWIGFPGASGLRRAVEECRRREVALELANRLGDSE